MTISATTQGLRMGVATSSSRPTVPFDGQVISETDTDSLVVYNGTAWVGVVPPIAIFNETQSAATEGGSSVTGSFIKRTLNTTNINEITSATLTSSVISLPAGTYLVTATAPFYATSETRIRLRNTTDSTTTIIGQNGYATSSGTAVLNGQFTITATKDFELQYRCAAVQASYGLGVAQSTFGESSVYSVIQIQKVA